MREAFAMQKLRAYLRYFKMFGNFNDMLTNDALSFEQPDPDVYLPFSI